MTEIRWKMRVAIVFSFVWLAITVLTGLSEKGDGIAVFLSLGVQPPSLPATMPSCSKSIDVALLLASNPNLTCMAFLYS